MKFIPEDTQVILREVPDEISLSVNISNCPHRCPGCHSPYLREDVGEELTIKKLDMLIEKNSGVSCVCFFGGDADHASLIPFFIHVRERGLRVAWYSGDASVDDAVLPYLDYYKVGPYIKENGPLDSSTTNQRMYKVTRNNESLNTEDITFLFKLKQI